MNKISNPQYDRIDTDSIYDIKMQKQSISTFIDY